VKGAHEPDRRRPQAESLAARQPRLRRQARAVRPCADRCKPAINAPPVMSSQSRLLELAAGTAGRPPPVDPFSSGMLGRREPGGNPDGRSAQRSQPFRSVSVDCLNRTSKIPTRTAIARKLARCPRSKLHICARPRPTNARLQFMNRRRSCGRTGARTLWQDRNVPVPVSNVNARGSSVIGLERAGRGTPPYRPSGPSRRSSSRVWARETPLYRIVTEGRFNVPALGRA
jgi:hypothetical protein